MEIFAKAGLGALHPCSLVLGRHKLKIESALTEPLDVICETLHSSNHTAYASFPIHNFCGSSTIEPRTSIFEL
jgi:hypothetical protein